MVSALSFGAGGPGSRPGLEKTRYFHIASVHEVYKWVLFFSLECNLTPRWSVTDDGQSKLSRDTSNTVSCFLLQNP